MSDVLHIGSYAQIIKRVNLVRAWNDNPEVERLLKNALALIIEDIREFKAK